ncbi:MAG: ribbon-helix-helix protein, CopG family [Deltaproteobacteria bacterium]|nr:ribbon-helix-helix protein, CopG family [Deltaproteobacteria bacterium]
MNVTLSADSDLLHKAREVARRQGKSLNELFRDYLRAITSARPDTSPADDLFALMDDAGGRLDNRGWRREELHERR